MEEECIEGAESDSAVGTRPDEEEREHLESLAEEVGSKMLRRLERISKTE